MIKKILVGDDSEQNRRTMAIQLTNCGHTVETAASMQELLDRLASCQFDLVITDYDYGDDSKNGLCGLDEIRANVLFDEIPVIVHSNHKDINAEIVEAKGGIYVGVKGGRAGKEQLLTAVAEAFS